MSPRPLFGIMLFVLLATPPFRVVLESSMALHMWVQLPLLIVSGVLASEAINSHWRHRIASVNRGGITGTLIAAFALVFWMLPRNLDAALASPLQDGVKFATLALLAGVPLRLSWPALSAVARGLVWSNVIAMLLVLAWAYLAAPIRVCNNYRLDQQVLVGQISFALAALVTLGLLARLFGFTGSKRPAQWENLARNAPAGETSRPERARSS